MLAAALLVSPEAVIAQTLRGSSASLDRQNAQAIAHDFTYLRTRTQLQRFVNGGYLVRVVPNRDFSLHDVSFPYARAEVKLFIERLASQYRAACGEELVVTSLTRPTSYQPPNASERSVHPTGMAVDLRRSGSARCRNWLEQTLLTLESAGTLDAIKENYPPHYHVALFPEPYVRYVETMTQRAALVETAAAPAAAPVAALVAASADAPAAAVESGEARIHVVARGESLWAIARTYGVPESRIQIENGLRGNRILAGQRLRVPVTGESVDSAAASIRHRVRPGESLWSIALQYDASIDAIRAVNGMRSTRIFADQVLEIPGSR